jgi:integrase
VPDAAEIRFLTLSEVRLVIEHAPGGIFHALDRAAWLTAAMTGLRKGELVALRWRDIDWAASRIHVRKNYVRGEFGSPKSKRSTPSVPMADAVGGELDRLSKTSRYAGPDELVFAHPRTSGLSTEVRLCVAAGLTIAFGLGVPMRSRLPWRRGGRRHSASVSSLWCDVGRVPGREVGRALVPRRRR